MSDDSSTLWPHANGEMAERIAAFDWSRTPLGPIEIWPDRLRLAVEMVLDSPSIASLVCGPERVLIYNDAASRIYGDRHPAVLGRPLPHAFPEGWKTVAPFYERAFAGEALQVLAQPLDTRGKGPANSDMFDAWLTPVRDRNGGITAVQMTGVEVSGRLNAEAALRESQERQAFLLTLSDALRPLDEPFAIQREASRILRERLGADRVAYAELDLDENTARLLAEDRADDLTSFAGLTYAWSDFDPIGHAQAKRGRSVSRADVQAADDLTATQKATFANVGFRALINVPLLKSGRLVAFIAVHFRHPHASTRADVALVEETAERTWAAVQRARSEKALRTSEERLRGFGEASTDVLWIRDIETLGWTYLTPAFETIYGMPRDEALAGNNFRNWVDLIVPEDRQHAVDMIGRVRHGESVVFEYRIQRPSDGSIRWLRNTDFPIRDAKGHVTAIGGVGHDASQEKEAHRIVRASRRQMRTLIEGVPQLVWRGVNGGGWTWSSPQWTAFTGLSEAASTGRGWLAAIHPDDHERAMEAWRRTEATEEPLEVEYRLRQAGGGDYRWFQTRALPVRDEDTHEIVEWLGTSTDIHELRQLQDEQNVMVAELQHRTRNLIAVVASIARQTMAETGPSEAFQGAFKDRMEALSRVQGLLSQAGEEQVTVRQILEVELTALGVREFGPRVQIDGPDVPLRKSIVQTLTLAIHELATNARKYGALSNGSGKLNVRWKTSRSENEERRLFLEWIETGIRIQMDEGEAVTRGSGYGRKLIEKSLPYTLKAKTAYELSADGLRCTIDLPLIKRVSKDQRP